MSIAKPLPAAEQDPLQRLDWSVMIKTRAGVVSLLRNLNLRDAVKAYDAAETKHPFNVFYTVQSYDVVERQIIGPEGWDGCRVAMHHNFDLKEKTCDGGPNKGLRYKSGACTLCGQLKFVWIDEPKE